MLPKYLQTLRNKKPLKLFDRQQKIFIQFQLNKKENFICWERWVSKDRRTWVNQNKYLSLKDVWVLLENFE